jgi:hypothetical protein
MSEVYAVVVRGDYLVSKVDVDAAGAGSAASRASVVTAGADRTVSRAGVVAAGVDSAVSNVRTPSDAEPLTSYGLRDGQTTAPDRPPWTSLRCWKSLRCWTSRS